MGALTERSSGMKNTKRTPSLHSKPKLYPLHQSPFYKLKVKSKLFQLVGITKSQLAKLSQDKSYNIFTNENGRTIQEPIPQLKLAHKRIGKILSRIEMPSYLHSGRKKHSTLTNARAHIKANELLKLDIHHFFPSTTAARVYNLFHRKFDMSPDVAYLITNFVTYSGRIPTGSPISMALAFWANWEMFDEINKLAISHDLVFTVYVDDLAFSGEKIPKGFASQVKSIISSNGLISKRKKEIFYPSSKGKLLTGVVIQNGELKVRWAHNASIKNEFDNLSLASQDVQFRIKLLERLTGKLHAAGQVDYKLKDKARFFTKQLKIARCTLIQQPHLSHQ